MINLNMTNRYWIYPKNSQASALGRRPWRLLLVTLVLGLVAVGCANRKATPTSPADSPIAQRGDWFCQPAAPGADEPWECIQDAGLAANPKPDRLPNANDNQPGIPPAGPALDSDTAEPNPQINGNDLPLPDQPPPPPGLSQQQGADPPGSTQNTPATAKNLLTQAQPSAHSRQKSRPKPDYIRLAFQPPQPVSILDLPSNYYAVQLATLTSANDIETFVEKHQLNNLTAAKVTVNGKIRYVLILGIYDSREKAELAAAGQKPAPLVRFTPWVRKLSNLQKAMLAAESKGKH